MHIIIPLTISLLALACSPPHGNALDPDPHGLQPRDVPLGPEGQLSILDIRGGNTQHTSPHAARLHLDLELRFDTDLPQSFLGARLIRDGELTSTARSAAPHPIPTGRPTLLAFDLDISRISSTDLTLELFSLPHSTQDPETLDLISAHSPPLATLPLRLERDANTPRAQRFVLDDLLGPPTAAHRCEDGRLLIGSASALSVLDPAANTHTTFPLTLLEPIDTLHADWRCTRAHLKAGDHVLFVDLFTGQTLFDERVESLAFLVHDPNPRYVTLLLDNRRIKRVFLRDMSWSTTRGKLPNTPRAFVSTPSRLAILTDAPSLCLLLDHKKVRPRCVDLPFTPRLFTLLPFGLEDAAFTPHDPQRASLEFEDALPPDPDTLVLGTALLIPPDEDRLVLFSLDHARILLSLPLSFTPTTLDARSPKNILLHAHNALTTAAPLDAHVTPARTFTPAGAHRHPDTLPLASFHSPDAHHLVWFWPDGVDLSPPAQPRQLFAQLHNPRFVLWHPGGDALTLIGGDDAHTTVVQLALTP